MYKQNKKPSQWVNLPFTKNGAFFTAGKLLRISPLKKPKTNPRNAPKYELIDISGKTPQYLSGLWDNGDHFGGDIQVDGEKVRFKIRKTAEGFQESGLSEAISRWTDNTPSQNSLDIDTLQLPTNTIEELPEATAEGEGKDNKMKE